MQQLLYILMMVATISGSILQLSNTTRKYLHAIKSHDFLFSSAVARVQHSGLHLHATDSLTLPVQV